MPISVLLEYDFALVQTAVPVLNDGAVNPTAAALFPTVTVRTTSLAINLGIIHS